MSELDKLKDILFGNEKQALDALTRRLETRESRVADISDVLPESISRASDHDEARLAESLQTPVEHCIRQAVRRQPQQFADALFPVMGPAIRRAIAAAIQSMARSINYAIETGLSPKRQITWRFRAWRAGVPLGEYVLQRTLRYRVEHAYLIQPDSGLAMGHVHHPDAAARDGDAVSAMLSAIQDFVRDSFDVERGLQTADLGEFTLWAIQGPHATLACLLRGVAPPSLRPELAGVLERIHLRYGDALREFDGDPNTLAGVAVELEHCLQQEEHDESAAGAQGSMLAVWLLLAAVILVLGYVVVDGYRESRRVDRLLQVLRATPGVVPTEVARARDGIVARGLRDPLAPPLGELITAADVPPDGVIGEFTPYQSLEPELVLRRAERRLEPPASVQMTLEGDVLQLAGKASADWVRRAQALAPALAGVARLDASALAPDDAALLEAARSALSPPGTVRLAVDRQVLSVSGRAPAGWIAALPARAESITGLAGLEHSELVAQELVEARALAAALDGREVYFASEDLLRADQAPVLDGIAVELERLLALASDLGIETDVTLNGHTDVSGTAALNAALQLQRADAVARELERRGVSANRLARRGAGGSAVGDGGETGERKVVLEVLLDEAGSTP